MSTKSVENAALAYLFLDGDYAVLMNRGDSYQRVTGIRCSHHSSRNDRVVASSFGADKVNFDKREYNSMCAVCHGIDGKGKGPYAGLSIPGSSI